MTDAGYLQRDGVAAADVRLRPMDLPALPENPLVSVLMANYNYARYVGEAIESVIAQTYQNFEICVCDDGSTDDSVAVIERYARRDWRVKLVIQGNSGVAAALNAAYRESSGQIVCLLDSDDLFMPGKVEAVVLAFRQSQRSGMCVHHFEQFSASSRHLQDTRGAELPTGWLAPSIIAGYTETFITASGLSWRREVTEQLFPIPTTLRACVDAYLARAGLFTAEVTGVNSVLMRYRVHGDNLSARKRFSQQYAGELLSIAMRGHEALARYLERRYGREVARFYQVERSPYYWFLLLVAGLYTRPHPTAIGGVSVSDALGRVSPRQRVFLRVAWWLPATLTSPVLAFWLGHSPGRLRIGKVVRACRRLWCPRRD